MNEESFWGMIYSSRNIDIDKQVDRLIELLSCKSDSDIKGFHLLWRRYADMTHNYLIYGAAAILLDGLSDNRFEYFQNWLILQGKKLFDAAMLNPDILALFVEPGEKCWHECYPWSRAYERKHNLDDDSDYEMPGYPLTTIEETIAAIEAREKKNLPDWFDINDETELIERYPRLFGMFFE